MSGIGQRGVKLPAAHTARVGKQPGKVFWFNVHPHVGHGPVAVDGAELATDHATAAPLQIGVQVGQAVQLSAVRGQHYTYDFTAN